VYSRNLNVPINKEIQLPGLAAVSPEKQKINSVVFEYKGLRGEIDNFISLAHQFGFEAEIFRPDSSVDISRLSISFERDQFGKFIEFLNRWKINGR
jgi:hypothetical protein